MFKDAGWVFRTALGWCLLCSCGTEGARVPATSQALDSTFAVATALRTIAPAGDAFVNLELECLSRTARGVIMSFRYVTVPSLKKRGFETMFADADPWRTVVLRNDGTVKVFPLQLMTPREARNRGPATGSNLGIPYDSATLVITAIEAVRQAAPSQAEQLHVHCFEWMPDGALLSLIPVDPNLAVDNLLGGWLVAAPANEKAWVVARF
jgi:hypothetical protein